MVRFSPFLLTLFLWYPTGAKDLGVHGHTFMILEEDLLSAFEQKLVSLEKTGIIEEQRNRLTHKAATYLTNPQPVPFLKKTTHPRVFYFDPTVFFRRDLKDHKGHLFYKAGTPFNPLTVRKLSKTLIFLSSQDEEQVTWLKDWLKESKQRATIVLVSGNPMAFEEDLNQACYFDQEGRLSQKLKLTQVPAIVQRDGLKLRIEEIDVKEKSHVPQK